MSQISVHNDSSLATIHSSNPNVVKEAVKHLTAVLKLIRPVDQLRMVRFPTVNISCAWQILTHIYVTNFGETTNHIKTV